MFPLKTKCYLFYYIECFLLSFCLQNNLLSFWIIFLQIIFLLCKLLACHSKKKWTVKTHIRVQHIVEYPRNIKASLCCNINNICFRGWLSIYCNLEKSLSNEAKPRLTMYFKGLQYIRHPLKYMFLFYHIECSLLSFRLYKIICHPSEFSFFFNIWCIL